ncbi:xanthine/uracil/vitamin C permease [Enterovibrio sp. ZSDZ35]|uniref:Xanthine/uracil/vitamin C permease n=1 Tax=Enterovibrio qingdaonensis TaxID=2899818 RepID=A0ABT5QR06_9GAMM|nr:xanthine/uracil/vitamin C permease [Enterovibrio sp. ZSDZ35]MDD1783413.1 xanthine/uracil/vitamin C permease [Enterovibrio sp. ZSDZ35]
MKREHGEEQPYIPAGPFKLRIPFIHVGFEKVDFMQGLLLCAVCLGMIPILQEYLGMPFEVAVTIVVLNGLFYFLHILLGDPIIPGWITPAIPIVILYLGQFDIGVERVHALIAFQISLGVLSILLGVAGLGERVASIIPNAMKSGIIIGAGIAAVNSVLVEGGRFEQAPISIIVCTGVGFYLLFSSHFKSQRNANKFTKILADLGSLPIILLAIIVGPLVGEIPWPQIEWGFTTLAFGELFQNWTIFGLGWPPLEMFVMGLPAVISTYIILFGDVVQAKCLLEDASKKRPDEKIDYNANRSNMIFGMRNVLMGIFGPTITLCGPLAAAMQVVVCERFKLGPKTMNSINNGAISYRYGTFVGYFLLPIVTLVKPVLGIALAATLLIQGFVSFRVGVTKSKTVNDLGIAGVMAAIIATKGAAWGLGAGIILCLFVNLGKSHRHESEIAAELESTELRDSAKPSVANGR